MKKQRTRKWMYYSVYIVLIAVLAFQQFVPAAGVNADQSEPEESAQAETDEVVAEAEVAMYPVTANGKVLENERYELFIDEATANVRLVAKGSGREWHGAPIVPRTTMPNNKKFMDSPVHIRYTEGADITSTYSLKDKETKATIQAGSDVVRAEFEFGLEKISFALEYRLSRNGLEVSIPYDSIREEGRARLISIEPLPFLNAASETEQGAMLLPDGSGALLHFREDHPMYLKGYSEFIYGPDPTFITQTHDLITDNGNRANTPRQFAALPVFGMYRDGAGTLGIVTQGEFDAKINGTPAGVRAIPLYRSSVEFVYRKNDVIFIGSSGQIPYYQGNLIKGDRQLRYVLLEGEQAGYVGMAAAYKDYLESDLGIKPVGDQSAALQVKLLGGILRDEIIGSTFIRMTTFDQAAELIGALRERGVDRLGITLDGWSKDGLYGNQPDHFPAARQLGGGKGLERLARYASEQAAELYLRANYVRAIDNSKGFKKKDTVRGMDREVLELTNYYIATRWRDNASKFYLMKPERVYEKRIAKELGQFAAVGASGVQLQYMGSLLYSDEDPGSFLSRAETAAVWTETLRNVQEQVGKAAVDYGFAYTFGQIDRIDNVPLWHSGYVYTDEAVPFYQLALHGLIPYYASPSNLREDAAIEFLKAIEYGAMPSYELTHAPTSGLHRTLETRLFSSGADDWLDIAAAEYAELRPLFEAVAGEAMIDHEKLQPGVYRTTYGDGTQVIVNYNKFGVQVGGVQVEAMNYAVTGG